MKLTTNIAYILIAGLFAASAAQATPTAYSNIGTINPVNYTFTAASTGDIMAYFAGSTAGYDNTLGLLVNGIDTGFNGLDDHTSVYGQQLNFGNVNAGDVLTFKLNVLSTGNTWYSNRALNSDQTNHIYSNSYAGDIQIPAGTYVAFEDVRIPGADLNYHDENFVFTNVQASNAVPVPATTLLMGLGLLAMSVFAKRKTQE
ncbi:PEP-CTERM sorting domain-containing protein [Glaciimonas sp. GNP009]